MKLGIRTPNLNKRLKARTTGKMKRAVKKAYIPGYGKKGTGWIKNPKRALYNKAYNKTTISADRAVKSSGGIIVGLFKLIWFPFKLCFIFMFFPFWIIYKIFK